ncbi:CPBP family intramembrane glutamic endopeptidase [Flavobacterium sp. 2]|uniref:CPBP family intramembrane glutamic endopeptidase n=1 Tax=Flavobacterium sp. 2 TaxID=308053 RepID=UPI003CF35B56
MLGIILLLVLFSCLVLLFEKKLSDVPGLIPTKKRILYFFSGVALSGILVVLNITAETILFSLNWKMRDFHYLEPALVVWQFFLSVFTEELIFRGIIIYILMRKLRKHTAMLISSALFGFYHWFSYEMFGAGLVPMLYVFLMTSLAGYCWAFAYLKSRTLLLPLGMHLGWNCINWVFAKKGTYGQGLFVRINELALTEVQNLILSLLKGLVPVAFMYLVLKLYFDSKNKSQIGKFEKTSVESTDAGLPR